MPRVDPTRFRDSFSVRPCCRLNTRRFAIERPLSSAARHAHSSRAKKEKEEGRAEREREERGSALPTMGKKDRAKKAALQVNPLVLEFIDAATIGDTKTVKKIAKAGKIEVDDGERRRSVDVCACVRVQQQQTASAATALSRCFLAGDGRSPLSEQWEKGARTNDGICISVASRRHMHPTRIPNAGKHGRRQEVIKVAQTPVRVCNSE